MKIGRVTASDRAANKVYADESGPEIERVVQELFANAVDWRRALVADEKPLIEQALRSFADDEQCELIITTGGTGPGARDVTTEATRALLEKELPGFGEIMRMRSYEIVPTAILSRATAGIRGRSLIVNLPGRPRAIAECLPLIAPAIAEAVEHLTGTRPSLRAAADSLGHT
jgi:molybdopterin adenylyltransferase